jgi:hypothetical protein
VGRTLTVSIGVWLSLGCGGSDDGRSTAGGSGIPGGEEGGSDTEVEDDDGPGTKLDVPDGAETGSPDTSPDDECVSYSEMAENTLQPADIVFVVDNSGSMGDEAGAVQANLNSFSQQIIDSGIDVHVVLISSYPEEGNGICVEPPLGSGGCPAADSNPPVFTHIDQEVDSNNALQLLLGQHAAWAGVMREDAAKHIVIVTDDESDLDAVSFDNQFRALDPSYIEYKLHGIVSMENCADAAEIGNVYIILGQLTGGLLSDLCDQNFQPVFDLLATEVIGGSVLACEWAIPEPPEGETLDPNAVNVEFDDGQGMVETIGRVDDPADCAGVADGWYYDDPAAPTTILACPQTCERMQNAMMASVSIQLGCATIPAG